jgi:hypothetical protein
LLPICAKWAIAWADKACAGLSTSPLLERDTTMRASMTLGWAVFWLATSLGPPEQAIAPNAAAAVTSLTELSKLRGVRLPVTAAKHTGAPPVQQAEGAPRRIK